MEDQNIIFKISRRSEGFVNRHDLAFKSIFVSFLILFIALQPALMEGDVAASIPRAYNDFGVFEERDALLYNLSSLSESTEIAQEAEAALDYEVYDITDSISSWDGISEILTMENITLPDMTPPGIFDKALDLGVDSITDTLLDGRYYYIYANSSNNPHGVWVDRGSVSDPLKEPRVHAKLTSDIIDRGLQLFEPTPVDIDSDGTDDVEVELLIEANVAGGLSTILDDPFGLIPTPSVPSIGIDAEPNVRIVYPPTNNWIVGRSLISDTWTIGGWVYEFDLETDDPEIENVVVSIDKKGPDANWEEANLSGINSPFPRLTWFRWTYDIDLRDLENGLHTVYVRAYEGNDYGEDEVNILVSNPDYRDTRLLVKVDKINPNFHQSSEINILKPTAHGGAKYVWSLGLSFENVTDQFEAYVMPESISLAEHLPSVGSLLTNPNFLEFIEGPYHIGWNATNFDGEFGLCLSHFTALSNDTISDRTWLKLEFPEDLPPNEVEITLSVNGSLGLTSNISAEAELVTWTASKVSNISLTYHDEREQETVHLDAQIFGMPENIVIEIENQSSQKPYDIYTSLHFTSSTKIHNIIVKEYIFEDDSLAIGFGVNISDVPTNFYLNGTYSALSIQNPAILNLTGSYTFAYLWDLVSIYIGRVLAQFAQRVVSLPRRFFRQSLLDGEYRLDAIEGQKVGSVEFLLTDSQYPQLPGNFLCIYNSTQSNLSIAGKLYGISHLFARSNSSMTQLEASLSSPDPFRLVNAHGDSGSDFELLFMENIPEHFSLNLDNVSLSYSGTEIIDSLEFMGYNNGVHLYLKLSDVPKKLNFTQTANEMELDAFDGTIGSFEFQVSESSAFEIEGDYLMLMRDGAVDSLSGRISNLQSLHYINTNRTSLACTFSEGKPFRLVGRIDTGDIDEKLVMDVHLDNIPDEISLSFENDRVNTSVDVPDIHSVSGISDVSRTLSGISEIGERLLDMMINVTTLLTTELSTFSGGFSVFYSFEEEYDLNVMAKIEFGDTSQLEQPIWTHGISARGIAEGPLSARIFLSNLPQTTNIDLRSEEDMRGIYFEIVNFSPEYEWFLLDVKVEGDLKILFYADNLKGDIDTISINSTFEISSLGTFSHMTGKVRTEYPLQNVCLQGQIMDPFPTKIEMMIPAIPESLDLGILAKNDISLNFSASSGVRFLLLNVSRQFEDRWYDGTVIVHDIPMELSFAFKTDTRYIRDTPLLGMPTIDVSASSDTLDLYVNMDGRVFGRRGRYEVFAGNIRSGLSGYLDNKTYKIRADSLENFILVVGDMPLMPMYKLKSLKLYVKDLKSIDISFFMGAGLLPAIQLENTDVGELKLAMSQEMDILGAKISPNVVFSESTFTELENPNIIVPFKSPTHINGLSTSLSTGRTTVIFPNILASVIVSFAPLFIAIFAILLFLYVSVRIYQRAKGEDEEVENEEMVDSKVKKGSIKWSRKRKALVILFLLIIMASVVVYAFIPRVELKVKTDFVQTPSGIFVICEAENSGTVLIEDLAVSFMVLNGTDVIMNGTSFSASILKRGDFADSYVHYFGDQFESYNIIITVDFVSYGRIIHRTLSHDAKDHMRLSFEDSLS